MILREKGEERRGGWKKEEVATRLVERTELCPSDQEKRNRS